MASREPHNPRETGRYAFLPKVECCACSSPATHWVRIANSAFRDEDDSVDVCGRHESMARANFDRFIGHLNSKAEFLADPDALKVKARERREKDPNR